MKKTRHSVQKSQSDVDDTFTVTSLRRNDSGFMDVYEILK